MSIRDPQGIRIKLKNENARFVAHVSRRDVSSGGVIATIGGGVCLRPARQDGTPKNSAIPLETRSPNK